MSDFAHVTTEALVKTHDSVIGVFRALLNEVRELSKKKPDATLSASKVTLINKVLADLLTILRDEPEGKYLEVLESESLPQVSDALMMMVQFEAGLHGFRKRYEVPVRIAHGYRQLVWITREQLQEWKDTGEAVDGDE